MATASLPIIIEHGVGWIVPQVASTQVAVNIIQGLLLIIPLCYVAQVKNELLHLELPRGPNCVCELLIGVWVGALFKYWAWAHGQEVLFSQGSRRPAPLALC